MADNVKISYYARENNKVGKHSFYPQPTNLKTFGFERMCRKAANNTTLEVHAVRAAVTEYIKVAQEALLEGNRVEIGDQFVTLYPNLKGSVKDYEDEKTHELVVVTADDLTANKCRSRVGATVSPVFSEEFSRKVKWVKTDRHGNIIEEEDDTVTNEELANGDDDDLNGGNGGGSSQNGGTSQGGNTQNGGGTSQQGSQGYTLNIGTSGSGTAVVTHNGNALTSGTKLQEDDEVEIAITPAEGHTPTATINGSEIELTENDGVYTGSFAMPAQASALVCYTGSNGGDGGDDLDKD